jgi:2-oxoisovalerate dehydrogenase E1 component alpha subunit
MDRARSGEGGSVIEFMTYRLHDHTTADDARRYRGEEEVKAAWTRDPMTRLRTYLTKAGLWDEAQENAWADECGKRIDVEINAYLETPVQPVSAMFDYLYADMPPDVRAQRDEAIAAEGRKHG